MMIFLLAEQSNAENLYWQIILGIVCPIIVALLGVAVKRIVKRVKDDKLKTDTDSDGDWVETFLSDKCFQNVRIQTADKRMIYPRKMSGSFILHGDAGTGKSMTLKKHYLLARTKEKSSLCLFYEANRLSASDDAAFDKIEADIHGSRFDDVIFYFDGIDETDKAERFFDTLKNRFPTKRLHFRISCRDKFFDRIVNAPIQTERRVFDNFYRTVDWTEKALFKYAASLINSDRGLVAADKAELTAVFKSMTCDDWKKISYNPLMCQMLYGIIKRDHGYRPDPNRYAFYRSFLISVLVNHPQAENKLAEFSRSVFDVFDKHTDLEYDSVFDAILKPLDIDGGSRALLKHETFKEFLIAYRYNLSLETFDTRTADILSHAYTNDIADFISDGLLLSDDGEISEKLIKLYGFTRKNARKTPSELYTSVKGLSAEKFFRLKYEIIFRLGRLRYSLPERKTAVIEFLADVYNNDSNIPNIPTDYPDYWLAVLKRCCAISSSFLGGYAIEIEYVKHMLDWRTEYIQSFDLANRSHTLYFYGDIAVDNDIFGYIDTAADRSCDKALHKRIGRLSEINEKKNVAAMNSKELRKYYFRLFDIATVYTFIKSRKNRPELLNLSDKDKEIIKAFNTDYADAADENAVRAELLREIKNKTAELI